MASGAATTDKGVRIREITVPADEGQLGRVRDFIVEVCSDAGMAPRETSNTKLAVDEACTNIIKHADHPPRRPRKTLRLLQR
jgi:anti-sigma regulatory factor (Ser/Thr protein kinase)